MSVPGWLSQTAEQFHYPTWPPGAVATSRPRGTRTGPVLSARVRPFDADELEAAWTDWSGYSPVLADVLLVLARTGLRWSEARVLTVADTDTDTIAVTRSAGEGCPVLRLPRERVREVPLAARVRPIVQRLVAGRDAEELLLTTSLGSQLHRGALLRRVNWAETGRGRRLHDLRRTAAALWQTEGVDADTIRAWMG